MDRNPLADLDSGWVNIGLQSTSSTMGVLFDVSYRWPIG